MSPVLRLRLRLSALQAASFLGIGIYMPFFPVWLGHRGLDPTAIGIVLAIPILVRIVATAPLLSFADGPAGPRGLLVPCHLALAAIYPLLYLAQDAPAIAALVALMALAQACVIPANDVVTTDAVRDEPRLSYGGIRVWGSIAFLAASVGTGYAVRRYDPDVAIVLLALLPLPALAATLAAVPARPRAAPRDEPRERPLRRPIPRALWLVIGAAACIQSSHSALYAFGSLHWRGQGFSDPAIGWLWAVGVLAEIAVFAAAGRYAATLAGAIRLMALGAAAAALRFAWLAAEPGLAATVAVQALHGLTFGAAHLGTIAAVSILSPEGGRARAQGALASAVALAMATGTIGSGFLYRAAGSWVFLAMAPLGIVGLVLALRAGRGR